MDIKKETLYIVKLTQEEAEAFADGLEELINKRWESLYVLCLEELHGAFSEAIGKAPMTSAHWAPKNI